jgi:hypothetical protein
MLTTTVITTVVWITTTFLTAPTSAATLEAFYRRVRPGGRGWRVVSERINMGDDPIADGALSWVNWIAGVVSVYATLFGVGRLIFGPRATAIVYLVIAAAAFALIGRNLARSPMHARAKERAAAAASG